MDDTWERIHREQYDKTTGEVLGVSDIERPVVDEDKRDYIALVAMESVLKRVTNTNWDNLAEDAYNIADAMMSKRNDHFVDANKRSPILRPLKANAEEPNHG